MYDPIFMGHVIRAVHEDRVRALRRSRWERSRTPGSEGGGHQFTYEVGDVAYWPPAHDVAIFYADDGRRTIPSPGIVVIGEIDSGLDAIASAGGDFQMTIERID